jgi:hypothetical protein
MASVIVIASATVVIIALSDRLWPLQVAESLRAEMSLRGGGGGRSPRDWRRGAGSGVTWHVTLSIHLLSSMKPVKDLFWRSYEPHLVVEP